MRIILHSLIFWILLYEPAWSCADELGAAGDALAASSHSSKVTRKIREAFDVIEAELANIAAQLGADTKEALYSGIRNRVAKHQGQAVLGVPTYVGHRMEEASYLTFALLNAIHHDPRSRDTDIALALGQALILVGDPRVDQSSLMNWVVGLYMKLNDRGVSRIAGEMSTIFGVVLHSPEGTVVKMSQEFPFFDSQTLEPSFDFQVQEPGGPIWHIEIKTIASLRRPEDISSVVRGTIAKLAGAKAVSFHDQRLLGFMTHRALVIRVPFPKEVAQVEQRGSLRIAITPDGYERRYRQNRNGEWEIFERVDFFSELATNLNKIKGSDILNIIELQDLFGRTIVHFHNTNVGSCFPSELETAYEERALEAEQLGRHQEAREYRLMIGSLEAIRGGHCPQFEVVRPGRE